MFRVEDLTISGFLDNANAASCGSYTCPPHMSVALPAAGLAGDGAEDQLRLLKRQLRLARNLS